MLAECEDSILPDEVRVPHASLDNAEPQRARDRTTMIARRGEARAGGIRRNRRNLTYGAGIRRTRFCDSSRADAESLT